MKRIVSILLAENDITDQIEIRRALEKRNILHRLHIVRTGEDAITIMNNDSFKPDVILLNLTIPKMNGLEVLSKIKNNNRWKDIKIFILTSLNDRDNEVAGGIPGITGFITKPLKLESPSSMDAFNLLMDLINLRD